MLQAYSLSQRLQKHYYEYTNATNEYYIKLGHSYSLQTAYPDTTKNRYEKIPDLCITVSAIVIQRHTRLHDGTRKRSETLGDEI